MYLGGRSWWDGMGIAWFVECVVCGMWYMRV